MELTPNEWRANAGILMIPEELKSSGFEDELLESMTKSISATSGWSTTVPHIIYGSTEAIASTAYFPTVSAPRGGIKFYAYPAEDGPRWVFEPTKE